MKNMALLYLDPDPKRRTDFEGFFRRHLPRGIVPCVFADQRSFFTHLPSILQLFPGQPSALLFTPWPGFDIAQFWTNHLALMNGHGRLAIHFMWNAARPGSVPSPEEGTWRAFCEQQACSAFPSLGPIPIIEHMVNHATSNGLLAER